MWQKMLQVGSGGSVKDIKVLSNQIFTNSSPLTLTFDFEPNFVQTIFDRNIDSRRSLIYKDTLNNKKGYLVNDNSLSDSSADTCIVINGNTVTFRGYDDGYNSPNSNGAMVYAFNIS